MEINNLIFSVYGHSLFVVVIFLLITVFSKLNQGSLIFYGMMVLMFWLLVEVVFIVRAVHFWSYIGQLTIAAILAYIVYFLLLFFCEKFGRAYRGDGGLVALGPLTMYPLFIGLAIAIKAVILFWGYLF